MSNKLCLLFVPELSKQNFHTPHSAGPFVACCKCRTFRFVRLERSSLLFRSAATMN